MKIRVTLVATIITAMGCFTGAGLAAGPGAFVSPDDQVLVLPEFDRLHIETPVAPDLAMMNVRVFSPDNELLLNVRTREQSVEFLVNSSLPDGEYRYETVSIFGNVDLSSKENQVHGADNTMVRKFGSFKVSNGQIEAGPQQQNPDAVHKDSSLLDKVIQGAVNLAGVTLDLLIPAAQADTFSAVTVQSSTPAIWFDDTSTASGIDWIIQSDVNSTDDAGHFAIESWINTNSQEVFRIDSDGTTQNINSINVDPDGDLHMAGSTLNFDRGLSNLSIGTATTGAEIVMSAIDPEIRYQDESFTDYMYTNYDSTYFNIGYQGGQGSGGSTRIHWLAPANSLVVSSTGTVGIGTASPAAALNVVRGYTAQIRVNNTTASPPAGDQVMFQLQSAATNKVRFAIGNQNALWTFDNAGGSFQINLAGTGFNEFRVENDGDTVALGNSYAVNHINTSSREFKTDFAPVDEVAILEKVSELPMSTWRYKMETKGKRHLGPVAEDFKQTFGLSDGKHISTVDEGGVALAAIKGLNKVLQKRTAEIAELTRANSDLQKMNSDLMSANKALDERLTRLENVLLHQKEVAVR